MCADFWCIYCFTVPLKQRCKWDWESQWEWQSHGNFMEMRQELNKMWEWKLEWEWESTRMRMGMTLIPMRIDSNQRLW